MNRLFRRVYKHLDPQVQNPALTNATLRSKASDGVFCKPLQALVLAIIVFFF